MFGALLILLLLPFHLVANIRSNRYRPVFQLLFWIFVFNFLFLLWVGARPIAEPYILLGQLSTLIYFAIFTYLLYLFQFNEIRNQITNDFDWSYNNYLSYLGYVTWCT